MKLTTRSRYGLRAMTYIAAKAGEGPIPTTEIAESLNLSDNYLEQLLRTLKKDGFLRSIRGVKGGYELVQDPQDIMVLNLLKTLEGDLWLSDCTQCGECPGGNTNCPTRLIIRRMSRAIEEAVEGETLADMAEIYKAV
ncbi:Rrf2 family transcriptional regulator [Kallipyga massiliensis]|uniref:Rrf2 family transcriptional regulator n=1 Tax=Kallipyga massiliensis TaxID=1472764 RepID=UPI0026F00F5A|nr:Rrf2 family transcriptional regulator [Kallipyga massiliensis]